jgi:ornithine cyclodeaminase/alanine dehydrogenase-like protein (mu-crystallin family)
VTPPGPEPTRVLTASDVRALLSLADCIDAVEDAFHRHAEGRSLPSAALGVPAPGGGFHVKAAGLLGERAYFAAKVNANFPDNPRRFGLPTIQGALVLCDATTGRPLAVMASGPVTALRTGAATAVAARRLARPDARAAAVIGCGVQGEVQLAALAAVLPLERAWVVDADAERAEALARRARAALGIDVAPEADARAAARRSDVCATCTPARRPLLGPGDLRPGSFLAAVGADAAGKQELEPALLAGATVVVDALEQCAEIGELQHALAAGLLRRDDVHAELAEVVAGRRPGRTRPEEITIFDSTGIALEDVAAAVLVAARAGGRGLAVRLDD